MKLEQNRVAVDENYKPTCFNSGCKKTPHFEGWDGWKWCFRHLVEEIKHQDYKWFYFKNIKIIGRTNMKFLVYSFFIALIVWFITASIKLFIIL